MSAIETGRGPLRSSRWGAPADPSSRYLLVLSSLSFVVYLAQNLVIRAYLARFVAILRRFAGG